MATYSNTTRGLLLEDDIGLVRVQTDPNCLQFNFQHLLLLCGFRSVDCLSAANVEKEQRTHALGQSGQRSLRPRRPAYHDLYLLISYVVDTQTYPSQHLARYQGDRAAVYELPRTPIHLEWPGN
jgi:hypothetical protein